MGAKENQAHILYIYIYWHVSDGDFSDSANCPKPTCAGHLCAHGWQLRAPTCEALRAEQLETGPGNTCSGSPSCT